jgi:hypothetical protein
MNALSVLVLIDLQNNWSFTEKNYFLVRNHEQEVWLLVV